MVAFIQLGACSGIGDGLSFRFWMRAAILPPSFSKGTFFENSSHMTMPLTSTFSETTIFVTGPIISGATYDIL
eukprot:31995_4